MTCIAFGIILSVSANSNSESSELGKDKNNNPIAILSETN